ncbi:MAG: protein-L-isoaspartate O-methyltransferase family protein [Alphaproteobacteria bacterium]
MNFSIQREAMVASQVIPFDVINQQIIDAMSDVPREFFVSDERRSLAYVDDVQSFDGGRFMLTASVQGRLVQSMEIASHEVVLDVGACTGYSSSIAARQAATVLALECDQTLVEKGQNILSNLEINNVVLLHGDLKNGLPEQAPYDCIMVNGACEEFPSELFAQLAEGGRLAFFEPLGNLARLMVVKKVNNAISRKNIDEMFAPSLPMFHKKPSFVF